MKKFIIFLASVCVLICGVIGLAACAGGTEYSVACQACDNGCVIVADTKVKAGEKVILAARPNAGYKLTAFIVDGEPIDGVSFVMPEKDVTVSASFEVITYSITYVFGDAAVSDTYTVESYAELMPLEIEGYEICGWYRYCTEPENDYYYWDVEDFRVTSLEGLYGNLTLYARYYNPPHEINDITSEHGWCYFEDYIAYYGDTVDLTVVPDLGYELDYIEVNGERIEGTLFIMPMGEVEITAEFKPIIYTITYELDGGINSPNNPDFYTVEDVYLYFSGAEKEGYYFCYWYYFDEYGYEHHLDDYNGFDPDNRCDITLHAYFIEDFEE